MWGEVLNENILFKAATSANQMDPGIIARFNNGVIARYIQGDSTLDNDTLAAGEPCFLLPPGTSWDDSRYANTAGTQELGQKMYLASNVSNASHAMTGLVQGPPLFAGLACVAIPEGYWGWALIQGYMSYARCYDTDLAADTYLKVNTATATVDGMSVEAVDADGEYAVGFSWAADNGTAHTVAGYFDLMGGLGLCMDIA